MRNKAKALEINDRGEAEVVALKPINENNLSIRAVIFISAKFLSHSVEIINHQKMTYVEK